ncbi:MAG: radical SAM protein [Candidatus Hydrogenedentes bacterium]|nr:radical SAM protein [Candidatus Hydrogenedentota bacterium]
MSETDTHTRSRAALSLMAANVWRVSNVMVNRYLGRPPRYLPVILLFVTDRCNLRCRMCGVCEREGTQDTSGELTTDQYKAVITSAATRLGTSLASISGGEPLLRADIFEIIRFAVDAGISTHICTNGLLLNRERAERLRDAGIAAVSVSVDSPDASIHEYLRGSGTFQGAVDAIQLLRDTAPDIQVGINYLITRLNYRNMTDMVAYAERLGVQQIKFAPVHANLLHRLKAKSELDELYFAPEDLADLQREIDRLKERCRTTWLSTTSATFHDGIVSFYAQPRKFKCYAGYMVCAIGPAGQVAPCCDMDSPFSVQDRPLDVIWRDPAFHELRRRVDRCDVPCWDTTNTELSLRLQPRTLLRNLAANWRDLRFYSGTRGRRANKRENTHE